MMRWPHRICLYAAYGAEGYACVCASRGRYAEGAFWLLFALVQYAYLIWIRTRRAAA